mgnify:FL=1
MANPITNNGSSFEKAKGFLNITLVTKDGKEVRLPKGIPLRESNRTERAVVAAMEANPDAEIQVKATYQAVLDDDLEIVL